MHSDWQLGCVAIGLGLLTACSLPLWGDAGFGHIDPDDPDAVVIDEASNEDSPEAQELGWVWNAQGTEVPDLDGNGWVPQTQHVWVWDMDGGSNGPFTFDWDWGGSYVPMITTSRGETFLSTKIHVCENTFAILTIEDGLGSTLQVQRINAPRNDEACDVLCDGVLENCPFDVGTPGAVPPDCSDLTTVSTDTGNSCIDTCARSMISCVQANDCEIGTCDSTYSDCVTDCM